MKNASIAIFQKSIDTETSCSRPPVPNEVFLAAERVIKNHSCELIKTTDGMYIIKYNEFGPWESDSGTDKWMPVYIAKITRWNSGGITKEEFDDFKSSI